ncbi:DUF2971 domain-containing protein [Erwinia sp. Leaf53]|uniref:DUF2971 domain-containing protein n=1 Tax=Erwinia sp. Leaf53 TaxID=1736225 RepID=UPI0006F2E102|nr:DUF2971 domain-containing protein [Erwinia sp. Leaf53]KQN56711.1 hypothetical protein ASF13_06210 [Erwinia sp. Leaf53]
MVKLPKNLYKYLSYNENTVQSILERKSYYSDPAVFNDPLDCKPVVVVDVDLETLKSVACTLIKKRSEKEIALIARKLKVRGDFADNRTRILSNSEIDGFLKDVEYNSKDPQVNDRNWYREERFRSSIENEIVSVFKTGVLCLSRRYDSPLMWSHYSNNHNGLCIEYDMSRAPEDKARKIIYGGSRELKVSVIERWLKEGDVIEEIKNVCLLTKSREWAYENEWRMFDSIGLRSSYPPIRSIIFGMRCKGSTISAVIKLLNGSLSKIKYWKIEVEGGGFRLKRKKINPEEYQNSYFDALSLSEIEEAFDDLNQDENH